MMNCILIDDDYLSGKIIEIHIEKCEFLNLLQSFSDPIQALAYLEKNEVDLVFLDIEMPKMNGIQFINAIKSNRPQIILTTSHKEYALEAFESGVTDYLMKPVSFQRFFQAVTRAKNLNEQKVTPKIDDETVFVKKGNNLVRINNSDIVWIESLGDYIILNTEREKFILHSTMKAMDEKLPTLDYLRVHRSYIMRIDKIEKIREDLIHYKEKLIPIGKTYRKEVYGRLKKI